MQTEGFDGALGASYRLVEVVGRGAIGEVWRAVDRRTDETVAAKLLRAEHVADRELVTRFIQERSVLTGLRHPNLVSVRDLVVEGDRLAIVMDYVDGGSVREVIRKRGPLPPALAVGLAAEVLDGLAAAHDKRLVHRDIKPDNVLLSRAWEGLEPGDVRLTDFGIARIVGEGPRTTTGLLGTPEYMCPELLTAGTADLPADVYGVGILLYELLAGRTPFAGPGTDYTIAHRHVSSEPPVLPLPEQLWTVLETLLDKDPRGRPAAREAAASLRRLLPGLGVEPALAAQEAPDGFASARGPVTVVRGLTPEPSAGEDERATADETRLEEVDLGTPGQATVVRPMPRATSAPRHSTVSEPEPGEKPAWWRDPRVLGGAAATVVLIVVVAFVALHGGGKHSGGGAPASVSVTAAQQDEPLLTGLTISRKAEYDAKSGTAVLTITYATQNSPLDGPFLEVIPGTGSECPTVSWDGNDAALNLPSVTGIDTRCAWSVDPGQVPRQSSVSVKAHVSLPLGSESPQESLQHWLDSDAARTTKAVSDPQITSTSYAAQRLQGIDVVAPTSTVTGKTLHVTLVPRWPKGPDRLDPLYRSPSVGPPSSLLAAVAGGEDGVRFSDSCSGALGVSPDGLVVTTLTVAPECQVNARVGNFTDLTSNTFSIASRGG